MPDLSLIGQLLAVRRVRPDRRLIAALLIVFSLMIADFFDTVGTVTAVGAEGGLLDEDRNLPDVAAGAAGRLAGRRGRWRGQRLVEHDHYIESAAGVADGARTGLASVATGVLFLSRMFFSPLVQIVPSEAAAPGAGHRRRLMISQVRDLVWDDMSLVIPAFLTIALMPFTYSITNGIGAGVVSYVLLQAATGRARDASTR